MGKGGGNGGRRTGKDVRGDSKGANFTGIVNGVLLVTSGALLLVTYAWNNARFGMVLGVVLCACASVAVALYLFSRRNTIQQTSLSLVGGLLALALGILLVLSPGLASEAVQKAMGVWFVLLGLIHLLNTYVYKTDGDKEWVASLVMSALSFAMCAALAVWPWFWNLLWGVAIPVYFIVIGIAALANWPALRHGAGPALPMPLLADVFLPRAFQQQMDAVEAGNHARAARGRQSGLPYGPHDVEVLIHLSHRADTFFGHVDLALGGYVFTYGNYDHSRESMRLFGILADGVFVICPRKAYIEFSTGAEQKTMFGYRLALDGAQKKILVGHIRELMRGCTPWTPKEQDRAVNKFSWGVKERGARLYKVLDRRFKTYSALSSNCALLTEELLKGTGMPYAAAVGGIVTPGAVLSLYEKELRRKGSLVVGKEIYGRNKE